MKRYFLFFFALTFLFSCRADLEKGDKVALQCETGKFLSADRHKRDKVIGDRKDIGRWELFNIAEKVGNQLEITDFENSSLFVENDTMKRGKGKGKILLQIEKKGHRNYLKETTTGLYLKVKNDITYLSKSKGVILHRLPRKNIFGG